MRRVILVAAALVPMAFAASPAGSTPGRDNSRAAIIAQRRSEYPELMNLAELAEKAPAEFAAATFLRIAESQELKDQSWRTELIENGFQLAARAQSRLPVRAIPRLMRQVTRATYTVQASALRLDTLSLQTRAVRDMLIVEPAKGRAMFESIVPPQVRQLSCGDVAYQDDSAYFHILGNVVKSYTQKERERGVAADAVRAAINHITSPAELPAAMQLAAEFRASAKEYEVMASAIAAALSRVQDDDRAFSATAAMTSDALGAMTSGSDTNATTMLLNAYRQFVTQNLSGTRCEDNVGPQDSLSGALGAGFAAIASRGDSNAAASVDWRGIRANKVEPTPIAEALIADSEDAASKSWMSGLLFVNGHAATDADKGTQEWQDRFAELLKAIDELQPAQSEPAGRFYFTKAGRYSQALLVAPAGDAREAVLTHFVEFVEGSSFRRESTVEWFAVAEAAARLVQGTDAKLYERTLETFARAGDPVLTLWAAEERILPQRPSWSSPGPSGPSLGR